MTTIQLNRPRPTFIIEDEVEGMMAEDRNVLINSEQNKKKYLPTELWDIVKSYALYPPRVHQAIEIKCKHELVRIWGDWTNIHRMSHSYMNLKHYLRTQELKGYKRDYGYEDWKKVLHSRAIKAKEEALRVIEIAIEQTEKSYKERKQYYYSNSEFAVSFRKLYADPERPLPRWDFFENSYEDYIKTKTLLNL
jgi:hypothetical protein